MCGGRRVKFVVKVLLNGMRLLLAAAVCAAAGGMAGASPKAGERYVPSIWVDPDGCEHWVMDDGAEGYMTPHVTREGIPVCRRGKICGVVDTDQLFATDKHAIGAQARQRLAQFFRQTDTGGFIINGHTDSRASDAYNMALSLRRANAVASVAKSVGARIIEVNGYGERQPRASNATAAGMQQNRRVEIICVE